MSLSFSPIRSLFLFLSFIQDTGERRVSILRNIKPRIPDADFETVLHAVTACARNHCNPRMPVHRGGVSYVYLNRIQRARNYPNLILKT